MKSKRPLFHLLFLISCFYSIKAHSWIACTKYVDETDIVYSDSDCRGFPRNWEEFHNNGFGNDRGYNYLGQGCGPQHVKTYSQRFHRANYTAGERVCLAWPSKNHVATTSTNPMGCPLNNPHIPDNGISLYMFAQGEPVSVSPEHRILPFGNGVHVDGQVDFKGFQNCPNFCNNPDKSLCLGCFSVPTNIQSGEYTFLWVWQFNKGEFYSTCFDALIDGDSTNQPTSSPTTASTTSNPTSAQTTAEPTSTPTSAQTTAVPTSQPTSATTVPHATTSSETPGLPCSARYQCSSASTDYNFVDCVAGRCECTETFEGNATPGDKCRCTQGKVYWLSGRAYCLQSGQCQTVCLP